MELKHAQNRVHANNIITNLEIPMDNIILMTIVDALKNLFHAIAKLGEN